VNDAQDATAQIEKETGPERRCAVTGTRLPKERLIRFVLGPDGNVVPDIANELPGRGVWITADNPSLQKAQKGAVFRAFGANAKAPADLSALVERLLAQRVVALLGLCRRAGEAIVSFTKVWAALSTEGSAVDILVIGSDSGPSDRGKLLNLGLHRTPSPLVLGVLSIEEMSLAFGRENVVHAAIKRGGLAARIRAEAERLGGFRSLIPLDWQTATHFGGSVRAPDLAVKDSRDLGGANDGGGERVES
jgi:predicted RNA-binding protein YlxR (DUF448 family)